MNCLLMMVSACALVWWTDGSYCWAGWVVFEGPSQKLRYILFLVITLTEHITLPLFSFKLDKRNLV